MNRQEASSQYASALKQGRKAYKEALVRGRYPYPQVLDEIISDSMVAGQTELGVMEIPIDQIVGTKTAGRRSAFSADFLPLLDPDTEFAGKWVALCGPPWGTGASGTPSGAMSISAAFTSRRGTSGSASSGATARPPSPPMSSA